LTGEFGIPTLKMFGSLILILGLIIFLSYWLKRLRPGTLSSGKAPAMRLVGTLNLAPKRAVALVEISDEWFLVGVGTESVTLISKVEPPPQQDPPAGDLGGQVSKFHAILQGKGLLQPWKRNSEKNNDGNA